MSSGEPTGHCPDSGSPTGPDTDVRRGLYRRFFAWLMSRIGDREDDRTVELRERLVGGLRGTVLEIGAGAGANLPHLAPDVRYLAVEPNVHMHPYLRREAEEHGRRLEIRVGTAESLPAAEGEVDAVISTLVLCSVDDVGVALEEVRRVLKPGGRLVFIEHVGAEPGSALRRAQEWLKPLWRRVGDGCEPDRDLAAAIRRAGFERVEIEAYEADLPIPLVRPHIAGTAWV